MLANVNGWKNSIAGIAVHIAPELLRLQVPARSLFSSTVKEL